MQLLNARVAAGQAVFGVSTGNASRHARRAHRAQQRRGLTTVSVAAIEETAETAGVDSEFDKEAAYKRFESLLDEYTVSFATGDKVGKMAQK